MSDKINLIQTKAQLGLASDALNIAFYTEKDFHVQRAREHLVKALCGHNHATVDDLADMLGQAFMDGQDIDATAHSIGMCAVNALLDQMAPLFPESQEEAEYSTTLPVIDSALAKARGYA